MKMPDERRGRARRRAGSRQAGKTPVIALAVSLLAAPQVSARPAPIDLKAYDKCVTYLEGKQPAPPDAEKACSIPANQGLPGAQYALGALLVMRDKVPEGVQWLEKAARSHNPAASYLLARLYLRSDDAGLQARGKDLLRYATCTGYPPAQASEAKEIVGNSPDCSDAAPPSFEGTWVGRLNWLTEPPGGGKLDQLRVTIAAGAAKVYRREKDDWREVKPGEFSIRQLDETLVVSAIDSGWDLDGKWVETWTIHLLRLSDSEAMMTFVRTVNNVYAPEFTGLKTFSTVAEGRAARTAR